MFAPFFEPAYRGGGPIRTLSGITRTAPGDHSLWIITRDRDLGASQPLPVHRNAWIDGPHRSRIYYATLGKISSYAEALISARREIRPDVIYLNSFFDPGMAILPIFLSRCGFWKNSHLLIAPRGEFSPGALEISSVRKRAYIRLFRILGWHRSCWWHASTTEEAANIRALFGENSRILVREDETELPDHAEVLEAHRKGPDLRLIFLGRLSPKKGLHVLLKALRDITHSATLDVYGPHEEIAYSRECARLASHLPAHVTCTFHGAIEHDQVRAAFAEHDLFVFPTAGENFGHVVAEALSVGCPTLATDTTYWTDLLRAGGGVVLDTRAPQAWSVAIDEFAALGPAGWQESRERAAGVYESWARRPAAPHIFTMVSAALQSSLT